MIRHLRVLLVAAVLATAAISFSGCSTMESDLPWNSPASWEGTTGIPGFSGAE